MSLQVQQAIEAGQACEKAGDLAGAEKFFLQALGKRKKSPALHIRVARLYMRQARWQQALPHYQTACQLSPEQARFHLELARCATQLQQHELALEHFQNAIALAPDEAEAYYSLALLLEELKQQDGAQIIYQQASAAFAIAERTGRPFSLLHWARALERTGFCWDSFLLLLDKWPSAPSTAQISYFLQLMQRLSEACMVDKLLAQLEQRGWLDAPAEWLQPALLKLALTFSCFEPAILRLMTALQQKPHLPVATEALLLDLWFAWQGMTPEMLSRAIRLLEKPKGYSRGRALNLASALFQINDISRLNQLCQRYPELLEACGDNLGVAMVVANSRCGGEKEELARRSLQAYEQLRKESLAFWNGFAKDEESLAVVGNAAGELGRGRGVVIDRHRNVVRFNHFSLADDYVADYGRRTTIHVRPVALRWRHGAEEGRYVTPDDAKVILLSNFRLLERCNQWQNIVKLQASGKQVICFPAELQQQLLQHLGRLPSAGMTLIGAIKKYAQPGKAVNYFGFAFTDQLQPQHPAHYLLKGQPEAKHGWQKEADYFTELTGIKLPVPVNEAKLPVCLLGDNAARDAGCAAAIRYLKQELAPVSIPESHDYQLLLVNGGDALHHDSPLFQQQMLKIASAIGRRKKVALINTIWQANSGFFDFMLPYIDYIAVRDKLSQQELAEQHKVTSHLYLDLAYWQEINEAVGALDFAQQIVVTDYQQRESGDYIRIREPSLGNAPVVDLRTLEWSTLVKSLRTASLLVTGRWHGVIAACRAGIPFVAMKGETHELEGLIAMSGLPIPLCSSESELPDAISWALDHAEVYQQLFDFLQAQPRWQFAEVQSLLAAQAVVQNEQQHEQSILAGGEGVVAHELPSKEESQSGVEESSSPVNEEQTVPAGSLQMALVE